ncbi:hypothetical protein H0A61_02580 [Koleobacter methoxysyntrophicus]|jgi:hypothetical protein|uniref:Uncharacterized protein n=1 Tax=Koleobacter methoxysyntrophicus TaxID=2751313 RepID=A0A8A0RP52_9FIRM|nr:hypothetical protein [Koleobacter methoxysyntrophicus]MDK2901489.1 hypothetical protein [Thermosediminibacterales bacterium]QSQ10181.1 hypothetical protein H0A61_02580 [Koleobacter methoxysyntrophicus]
MNLKNINFKLVIIILIITLLLLFSIKYIYKKYNVEEPLKGILEKDERIQGYKIEKKGTKYEIIITLNNNFEDLDYVYREINNNISRIIKRENFKIELEGVENKKLKDAYYLLHFSLYENIEKGNFTQMYKDLVEISTEMNINEYKITIDNENIYLQLRDNDNSLYRVINRKQREIYTK